MFKTCLINQPAGLGDIFFLQKFVDKKISQGFNVIFPVNPTLIYVKEYIQREGLNFYSIDEDFPYKNFFYNHSVVKEENFEYYPFHIADRIIHGSCMKAKYTLAEENFNDWQDYFQWKRNFDKENELYYNILNLKDDEEYSLVSNVWGTPPNVARRDIPTNGKYKEIKIEIIEGYTPFDWSKVIEGAKEIFIVDTSFNYLIEKLNLRAENLYLTSRFTPPNFSHIINLFKKNWIYQN